MSEFDSSITAYFGGDTSGLNKAVGDAGQTLQNFSNKVADKVVGMRDVSTAIASALGLNIEKISQNVARMIAGVSEAEEAALKAIDAISTESADISIKNMRARLDDEQKYQLALQNREKLQRQVDEGATSGAEDQLRLQKLTLELNKQESEIIAMEAKQAEAQQKADEERLKIFDATAKAKRAESERQIKADIDLLSGAEKIKAMSDNILSAEALISAEKKRGKDTTELETVLAERKRDLNTETAKQQKEANDAADRAVKEYFSDVDKLAKLRFDALTDEQKIAKLREDESKLEGIIANSKKEHRDTTKEEIQLLEIQAQLKPLLAKDAKDQTEEEKKVTAELQAQADLLDKQIKSRTMLVANTYGRTDVDLSDRELAEKLGNLKKQFQGAQAAGDTGAFFFQQKIAEVEFEIGRRASFRRDYQLKGEKAFNDFSAFDEQTLRNYIRPEDQALANKQANAIIELNQNFKDLFKGGG